MQAFESSDNELTPSIDEVDEVDEVNISNYEEGNEVQILKSHEIHNVENNVYDNNTTNNSEPLTANYKDINLSHLKALVNERGLATNTNRMKKSDLIDLLEQADNTETNS